METSEPETNNNQLTKIQPPPRAPILANERGLQLRSLEDIWRFATAVVASKEFRDIQTPEQAVIRLQAGLELGLSPMWSLVNVMIVNGRPSLWGDALHGLILRQPDCEDVIETFEGDSDQLVAVCEVRRKGRVPIIRRYSVSDAKRANLWQKAGPWTNHPKRMLQMRARAFAERDAYSDVLRGLSVTEEMRDVEPVTPVTPTETPALVLPDEVEEKQ